MKKTMQAWGFTLFKTPADKADMGFSLYLNVFVFECFMYLNDFVFK